MVRPTVTKLNVKRLLITLTCSKVPKTGNVTRDSPDK